MAIFNYGNLFNLYSKCTNPCGLSFSHLLKKCIVIVVKLENGAQIKCNQE